MNKTLRYKITGAGITITGVSGNNKMTGKLVIPDKINGKSVLAIGNGAFDGCTGLRSVTIPVKLEKIGKNAFPATTKIIRK